MSKEIKEQKEDLFTEIFALMEKYYWMFEDKYGEKVKTGFKIIQQLEEKKKHLPSREMMKFRQSPPSFLKF